MSRPEELAPPEIFYGDSEARKYTGNTRVQTIQSQMTDRALELLQLPPGEPQYLLDIGCGSGLSGELLDEDGHVWVGVDIAPSMLEVALEREVEGDLFLHDIGQGFGFRPGTFDGCISISVLQWLMNADTNTNSPPQRLTRFFTTLHSALKNPSRAVFQFYPNSDDQVQLITQCAQRAGFGGGLVVDYPNSRKARKMYLCLMVGQQEVPKGLDGDDAEVSATTKAKKRAEIQNERRRRRDSGRDGKKSKKKGGSKDLSGKEWVLKKKELYRTRGKDGVPLDSKYTARKRRVQF